MLGRPSSVTTSSIGEKLSCAIDAVADLMADQGQAKRDAADRWSSFKSKVNLPQRPRGIFFTMIAEVLSPVIGKKSVKVLLAQFEVFCCGIGTYKPSCDDEDDVLRVAVEQLGSCDIGFCDADTTTFLPIVTHVPLASASNYWDGKVTLCVVAM